MKKGFTLIELLAVIVILAIIALIATPIVLNIIKDAKINSQKRSVENYIVAVEQAIARKQLDGTKFDSNILYVMADGNICMDTLVNGACTNNSRKLTIDVNGTYAKEGSIILNSGKISDISYLKFDDKYANYDNDKKIILSSYKKYSDGTIVYFNPVNGLKCSDYNSLNSTTDYNGVSPAAGQTSCLKWYIFLDDGKDTVDLLLDHNTSSNIPYAASSCKNGPVDALAQLKTDTNGWDGVVTRTDTYSKKVDSGTTPQEFTVYTLNYNNSKARLISAQEVADIVKLAFNEETTTLGYDNALYSTNSLPNDYFWMCNVSGHYWTSTPNMIFFQAWTSMWGAAAWAVKLNSSTNQCALVPDLGIVEEMYYPQNLIMEGIRPVITISKSKLN